MKKTTLLSVSLALALQTFSQSDVSGPGIGHQRQPGRYVGWTPGLGSIPGDLQIRNNFNQPINLFTNNIWRASITTNNGLTNTNLANYNFNVAPQTGDGIQVRAGVGSNPAASIDIFTSFSNQTFLRMDGTTLFQTTNNRFENISNLNGFWYNATGNGANGSGPGTPQYIWNIVQTESGRLGSNGKWRYGLNPGNLNANNRVEIVSAITDPYFGTVNGSSGIRTTNLTSANLPVANGVNGVNNTRVLTVDQNGDHVLVTPASLANADNGLSLSGPTLGNIHLGQNVGAVGNPGNLLNIREIPMNNFNLMFNDNALGGLSRIGFGFPNGTSAPTSNPKFAVENASYNVGGGFNTNFNPVGGGFIVGVAGRAQTNSGISIGVQGVGRATSGANIAIGVDGSATLTASPRNIGVRGVASGANGGNIGVWGQAPITTVQTPNAPPAGQDFAGFFNGDVVRTGTDNFTSDLSLKTNIDSIPNVLGIVSALKPRSFNYSNALHPQMNLTTIKQYGFVAQDIENILPELVMVTTFPPISDTLGNIIYPAFNYKTLNYQAFHAFSIRAIQELVKRIDKQDSIITALTSSVTTCCSSSAVRTTSQAELNQLAVTLSDKDAVVLNQNTPNPFAEQTTITYNVPEKYGYAQIIFSTIEGRILKTVDITKKGKGTLTVYSNDLSNGMYTYSLIVDGKTFDTKKMIKSE